jgi:hypothetical protein
MLFKGLHNLIDHCYHIWVRAYATTEFAARENFLWNIEYSNVKSSIKELSEPIHPLGKQGDYLGQYWWKTQEYLHEIANTGYEIFCVAEDFNHYGQKPHCDEFTYMAIANYTVETFGIIATPEDLDKVLHTLLLTTENLDMNDDNYDKDFAKFDPEIVAVTIVFYYFLRMLFEKESCGSISSWVTILVNIINDNYHRAEMLLTTMHGSGQFKPVPLTNKRNFAFGESPAKDWEPTQSEKFIKERREFLFITTRNEYKFDENLPQQEPDVKYCTGYKNNQFYMTH